ncbi:hypothetical protein [Nakamurella endophytica]|uniref:Uncharacterized protein n=1 Tax=Nakamurella endophytica TaxID=1748367 RepID=A0A917WAT7_9ACTN|nr:hypothetical protein [Nakamurella endophytica]GGL89554.1 hypothetical protein GCM10011594_06470 [Nakamurella endophytica]
MADRRLDLRCRWGLHDLQDFPDPNPESGGLEKQGYRACSRCPKVKDAKAYLPPYGLGAGYRR